MQARHRLGQHASPVNRVTGFIHCGEFVLALGPELLHTELHTITGEYQLFFWESLWKYLYNQIPEKINSLAKLIQTEVIKL